MNLTYLTTITGFDARENTDGSIDLIATNGITRPATNEETAAAKRLQLRDDINAERERRETLGLNYLFPDGQSGTIQMRNSTDFRNITGQTTKAVIMIMQGVSDPVLWFTDAENVRHPLTPAEMLLLGAAVQQHISTLYAASAEIKSTLQISNVDNFDITIGWPN